MDSPSKALRKEALKKANTTADLLRVIALLLVELVAWEESKDG